MLNAYPRPHMRRDNWINLNGPWDFAVSDGPAPAAYPETITVPYCMESPLSGIGRAHEEHTVMWYRRAFALPEGYQHGRVLLHCGGVDQEARVYINGLDAGFWDFAHDTLDITAYARSENEIVIAVQDHLSSPVIPYGKQSLRRGGMWYTPVSGIWQTVWIECVPEYYIQEIGITPRGDRVEISTPGIGSGTVTLSDGTSFRLDEGKAVIAPQNPVYWTPENPHLYDFDLTVGKDTVHSYFALRAIDIRPVNGIPRLCLNGKPYFFHGLLDQGYWPEGIYTPPDDGAYARDIQAAKALGFNTLRMHVKVEAESFYYACDQLGIVVFQDMVNNGPYSFLRDTALPTIGFQRRKDQKKHPNAAQRAKFLEYMEATVQRLRSHPCIVYWTIFNEGWGQFDSTGMYEKLRALDPTRIIDSASGWFRGGKTDVESPHVYFHPFRIKKSPLPVVLSEFGGYAWKIPAHSFNQDKSYGYKQFTDRESLMSGIEALYRSQILPAVQKGLCGCIYTQLTDIEDETNGLITYDRAFIKADEGRMQALAQEMLGQLHTIWRLND
ncbi:MAG: glycoside hydrolase family 2 [Clostridia bacterium]|nr:glycoside hydrolase family 2 [Clostridia bacterium]